MVDIGQASSSENVATLLYMRTCLMSASPPQFIGYRKLKMTAPAAIGVNASTANTSVGRRRGGDASQWRKSRQTHGTQKNRKISCAKTAAKLRTPAATYRRFRIQTKHTHAVAMRKTSSQPAR